MTTQINKQAFQQLAATDSVDISTLDRALKFMEQLRARGLIVKKQEVKAWYGNTSEAAHNRLRA